MNFVEYIGSYIVSLIHIISLLESIVPASISLTNIHLTKTCKTFLLYSQFYSYLFCMYLLTEIICYFLFISICHFFTFATQIKFKINVMSNRHCL